MNPTIVRTALYALSYYQATEESFNRLDWRIADTTPCEIVSQKFPLR
jgi:hypothetical protein